MTNAYKYILAGILSFFIFYIPSLCSAQQIDTVHASDSIKEIIRSDRNSLVEKAKRFGEKEINESRKEFTEDINATRQQELLDAIKKETFEASAYVKKGLDVSGLNKELARINNWYQISSDGIFINQGTAQTYRNLATSKVIVAELLSRLTVHKKALDLYTKKLVSFRNRIDSFATDSALFTPPSDSAHVIAYFAKLVSVAKEIKPADSAVKATLTRLLLLQEKVNAAVGVLTAGKESIEQFQNDLSGNTFQRDFPNLNEASTYDRPFREILRFSVVKSYLSLYFYINNNSGKLFILLSAIMLSFIFLRSLKNRLQEDHKWKDKLDGRLVLRYPLLSAVLICISLFQFTFIHPPFLLNFILWTVSAFALTFIFRGFITKYWMNVWLTVFLFFIVASLLNLILQASRIERLLLLAFSIVGFVATLYIFITGNKQQLKEKWIVYFIGLASLMELVSAVANMYGRYNFCKILLTTGFFNIVIGILFLWTVRLINEGLNHAKNIYTIPERRLFYINFNRVGNEVPVLLRSLLIIGWLILFGRNFYAFKNLTDPIHNFLFADRIIGAYTFSIQSVLLFFGILILSTFMARIVSFFAGDQHNTLGPGIKGLGSWLLLIRISIISIGLFIAFAAAGIPLDRITIIIGALSVGIGFGLQTLINNLVSGVILSFERPVNVGDAIEIGGKSGTMKSIGFRSSILRTWDGAEIIIPNGDLLNEHLVNWTLNDSKRRIDLKISVAYGSDLDLIKKLLEGIAVNDPRVAPSPAPVALAKDLGASGVAMELLFWAKDVNDWSAIKSDAIIAIGRIFAQNNIIIPFPQYDVHLYPTTKEENNEKTDKI